MEAFLQAKVLIRSSSMGFETKLAKVLADIHKVEATVSADTLKRWLAAGAALQPTRRLALLCGHPRSGTTLLEQVLDAHPGILSAEETPIFFETYLALKQGF